MGYSFRDDKLPKPHECADRRIHRRKITIERLYDFPAATNFGAAPEIRAHDRADDLWVELRLYLAPGLDAHFPQIGFAETGFRIDLVG